MSRLRELQRNGRIRNIELAARANLSESACLRRVKLLEHTGVIDSYTMNLDQSAVGLPGNVFAEITLVSQKREDLDVFETAVARVPEVMECYLLAGEYDYLLRVVVEDAIDYERVHHESLTALPGVARIKSSFSLRTITKRQDLPLG
ncbi:MAG: Lrp/AsnC family transcriptional regulator [Pseudomonadota bacterium]